MLQFLIIYIYNVLLVQIIELVPLIKIEIYLLNNYNWCHNYLKLKQLTVSTNSNFFLS